jgi:hypothetical protein
MLNIGNFNDSVVEENSACYQRFLRNGCVYRGTKSCQSLGVLIGLVCSVAGFYFASNLEDNKGYAVAGGGAGLLMMIFNAFSLGYAVDYANMLKEASKVKKLEEANLRLKGQIEALDQAEKGLSDENKLIGEKVEFFKDQVIVLDDRIEKITGEVKLSGQSVQALKGVREGLNHEAEDLGIQLDRLSYSLDELNETRAHSADEKSRSIEILELTERKVDEAEERFFQNIARIEEIKKIKSIMEFLETFKRESPEEFQTFMKRFPSLRS